MHKRILKLPYIPMLIIVILFLNFFPTKYVVYTPGSFDNLQDYIQIKNGYKSVGNFNSTSVYISKGTPLNILYSLLNPYWDYKPAPPDFNEQSDEHGKNQMKSSFTTALKVAYEKTNNKVVVMNEVCLVDSNVENIHAGDQIISINNHKVTGCDEVRKYLIASKVLNEYADIHVLRKEKIVKIKLPLKELKFNEELMDSINFISIFKLNTEPNHKIKELDGSGSSAGLMIALQVYDSLVEEDMTGGKIIAGTGTIDEYGNVGIIGGETYKLKAAVDAGADIFFVPEFNYVFAMRAKIEHNYDIDIVEVKTFDDALDYLYKNVVKK